MLLLLLLLLLLLWAAGDFSVIWVPRVIGLLVVSSGNALHVFGVQQGCNRTVRQDGTDTTTLLWVTMTGILGNACLYGLV
jgi:hypothetical protein